MLFRIPVGNLISGYEAQRSHPQFAAGKSSRSIGGILKLHKNLKIIFTKKSLAL